MSALDLHKQLIHAYRMSLGFANDGEFRYQHAEVFYTLIQKATMQNVEPLIRLSRKSVHEDVDTDTRTGSLKILIELDDQKFIREFCKKMIEHGNLRLSETNLKSAFAFAMPIDELVVHYTKSDNSIMKRHLLASLLHTKSEPGRTVFLNLVTSKSRLLNDALHEIARWGDSELLLYVIDQPNDILPDDELWAYLVPHPRLLAAFLLSLVGDRSKLDLVVSAAQNADVQAAFACGLLAWLSYAEVPEYIKTLLKSDQTYVRAYTLDAAATARSGGLVEPLLEMLSREQRLGQSYYGSIEAILRVLEAICGNTPFQFEYRNDYLEELTSLTVEKGYQHFYALSHKFDPKLRYQKGQLLTLKHLVDDLSLGYFGKYASAAYNLQAITGKDMGFDVSTDIVENYYAIKSWKTKINDITFVPGRWAREGELD